jgi:hypothetical protein
VNGRDEVIHLGLGLVRDAGEKIVEGLRRQHLAEEADRGQADPPVAESGLQ